MGDDAFWPLKHHRCGLVGQHTHTHTQYAHSNNVTKLTAVPSIPSTTPRFSHALASLGRRLHAASPTPTTRPKRAAQGSRLASIPTMLWCAHTPAIQTYCSCQITIHNGDCITITGHYSAPPPCGQPHTQEAEGCSTGITLDPSHQHGPAASAHTHTLGYQIHNPQFIPAKGHFDAPPPCGQPH